MRGRRFWPATGHLLQLLAEIPGGFVHHRFQLTIITAPEDSKLSAAFVRCGYSDSLVCFVAQSLTCDVCRKNSGHAPYRSIK